MFSILLTSCSNTLKEIGYISKLENPDGLRKIVDRLPFSLKLSWREKVDTVMQKENREVTVKDITDFIVARARVANHPIFGRIMNDSKHSGFSKTGKQQPRVKSYATQSNLLQPYRATGVNKDVKCPSCNSTHWLSQCAAFKKMSVEDRYKLVHEKKLCMNCLVPGHIVRDYPKKSFCRVEVSIPPSYIWKSLQRSTRHPTHTRRKRPSAKKEKR